MAKPPFSNWTTLASSLGLAYTPALSVFVAQPDAWYEGLTKPPLKPPNWVFGPVWTALYGMMGVAHYLYREADAPDKTPGQLLYLLQLLLNGLWSILFFRHRAPRLALINIIFLLLAIALTICAFRRVSRPAALLLVPYLIWVSFATYLNAGICFLNQE